MCALLAYQGLRIRCREKTLISQDLTMLSPEGHVTNWIMPRGDAEHILHLDKQNNLME